MSDTEIIGALELEFLINNPELLEQLNVAEANSAATTSKVEANVAAVSAAMQNATKQQVSNIQRLEATILALNQSASQTKDPLLLGGYANQIKNAQDSLDRLKNSASAATPALKNVKTEGLDQISTSATTSTDKLGKFEAAVARATDKSSIGAKIVNGLTRQFVGLAVGLIGGVIGVQAIEALFTYIAGLDIFKTKLNEVQQTAKYAGEALASTEYTKAVTTIAQLTENISLAKAGYISKTEVLAEYNKELGASLGYTNDINTAEANLVKKGQAFIQLTLLKATAQLALADATKKQLEIAKVQQSNTDPNDASNDKQDYSGYDNLSFFERIKVAIKQDNNYTQALLEQAKERVLKTKTDEKDGLLKIFADLQKQAAELAKKSNIDFFDTKPATDSSIAAGQSLLASYTSTLQKIEALKSEYASKDGTREQQAIDAIKAKFTAEVNAINSLNAKRQAFIDDYNRSHKNKGGVAYANSIGAKYIDPTQLAPVETSALAGLAGTQALEQTKQQVEAQKAIFKAYEDFKLKAGTDAANQLYGNELKGYSSYIEYLQNLQPSEADLTSTDAYTKARASALKDYLDKTIPAAEIQEFQENAKHLQDLIVQNEDYQTQRAALIEKSNTDIALLTKNHQDADAAQVAKNTQDQLTALDEANFKKLDAYKELFDGIAVLTKQQALDDIETLTRQANYEVINGKITMDAFLERMKVLNAAKASVETQLPDELNAAASALSNIGSSLSKVNPQLSEIFSNVSNILSGSASLITNFNTLGNSAASFTQKFAAGAGIVGTSISLISTAETTIASFFDHSAVEQQRAAEQQQYNAQQQVKANEAITKQLTEQLALIKDIYGTARLTSYTASLADITKAEADQHAKLAGKFSLTGFKDLDDYITKINNGEGIDFYEKGLNETLFEQFKQLGATVDLSTQSLTQLQKLLATGNIDQNTASIVQSLIDLKQQYQDTVNAINAETVGTSFDDLLGNIVSLFNNANTSAQDWANNFQSIIQGAISKSFERQYLETQLQAFYNELAADVNLNGGGALTAAQIKQLQDEYNADIANAQKGIKSIEQITGQAFGNPTTSGSASSTMQGEIKGITADQATILEGSIHGMQLAVNTSNGILRDVNNSQQAQLAEMRSQTLVQKQIAANTLRTADNTDTMAASLKNIDNNTSGSAAYLGRAAGKYGF